MNHFLKVVFAFSVIIGLYYYTDNSVEKIQNVTMKNLAYVILGDNRNPAYKEQQEIRLDKMLENMEKLGFNIDEGLLDALEENSYIHDIEWVIKSHDYRGLDNVILNFNLVNNKTKIPVKATFFVEPKPAPLEFFTDPHISKIAPMLAVEIGSKGKKLKFIDTKRIDNHAYVTFIVFYNEAATKSMFKELAP